MPLTRCTWARSELAISYHDAEWGTPQHDDRTLFELLVLEGAQAGLSWETILRKRAAYRRAFENFEIARVAAFGSRKVAALLKDESIVRNRLKIASAVANAKAAIAVAGELGSLDAYLWGFVDGVPIDGARREPSEIPASTPLSDRVSKDLRKRGFSFVGSTIVYAFMQATGMVNDHLIDCFRYRELQEAAVRSRRRTKT